MTLQRHDLIYISSQSVFSIQSCHTNKEMISQLVLAWLQKGLPCIYARQFSEETVNLGLPLFFDGKKHRVNVTIDTSVKLKQQRLPKLVEMHEFFLRCYGIQDICTMPNNIAVYGSLLFHYLSGDKCVDANSDLDLLIDYLPTHSLTALNELICLLNDKFNRTIDGEIRFKTIGDISIKELLDLSASTLLCKTQNKVELLPRAELYARYPML